MAYTQEPDFDLAALSPDIAVQKFYRDSLIDPSILGLFDPYFDDLVATGALAFGAELKNVNPDLASGFMRYPGLARDRTGFVVPGGAIPVFELPAGFKAPANARNRGFCIWMRPNPALFAPSAYYSLMGCGTGSSTDNQWAFQLHTNSSSQLDGLQFLCDGPNSAGIGSDAPAVAALNLFDGRVKQFSGEWEALPGDTQLVRRLYFEGLLLRTQTLAWDGNILQPSGTDHYPKVGRQPGFSALPGTYHRAWGADPTIAGSRSFAASVALDYAMNKDLPWVTGA